MRAIRFFLQETTQPITYFSNNVEISQSFCTLALRRYQAELVITEPLIDVCLEAVTHRLRYGRVAPCATLSISTAESGFKRTDSLSFSMREIFAIARKKAHRRNAYQTR
jgi:hypothetical protein